MRVLFRVLPFYIIFFLLGCASAEDSASELPPDDSKEPGITDVIEKDENAETEDADRSDSEGPDYLVRTTLPAEGKFLLAGMSSGFYDPGEEMAVALDHASRQLAVYYGAVVVSQDFLSEKTGSTFAARKIEIRFDEELAERLREDCIPGISYRGKDFFVTRVSLESPDAPVIPEIDFFEDENGRPSWLVKPPRIDGYITAVGSAQARRSLAESWEQSDKEGMAGIAESLGTEFRSLEAELAKEGGGAYKAESYVISSERIAGMYVIARWRSPDRRTYYSLVVKKKD